MGNYVEELLCAVMSDVENFCNLLQLWYLCAIEI